MVAPSDSDSSSGDEFWVDARIGFIARLILASYPKLSAGEKIDKLFRSDDNK